MSQVYLTSDWHLGHKNIHKIFRPIFTNELEHDECILDNYLSVIKRRDIVYFLGDVAFDEVSLTRVRWLPGTKILIMGNHDTDRKVDITQLALTFDDVCSLKSYKGAWLSHAPIHPDELRGKINIHGHTHHHCIPDPRYINVCVEKTGYKPILFQEIMNGYKSRIVPTL